MSERQSPHPAQERRSTPSQAEGERQPGSTAMKDRGGTPSQAEGERETVEQDLREKEARQR